MSAMVRNFREGKPAFRRWVVGALLLSLVAFGVEGTGLASSPLFGWLSPVPDDRALARDYLTFEQGLHEGMSATELVALEQAAHVGRWCPGCASENASPAPNTDREAFFPKTHLAIAIDGERYDGTYPAGVTRRYHLNAAMRLDFNYRPRDY